ncbi:MAG: hypothetical protein KJ065_03750 [Anaerolineae bacterium]|nr:hypothetical protein [Anaerolineae bacterium]
MLIRLDGLLRALVVLLALVAFGLYAFVVINRINYPFELEWMEGATVDTVSRILDGQSIYTEPTTTWVSPLYGPFSYYIGAGFARLCWLCCDQFAVYHADISATPVRADSRGSRCGRAVHRPIAPATW